MKDPCEECIVQACCTQVCENKKNYNHQIQLKVKGLTELIKTSIDRPGARNQYTKERKQWLQKLINNEIAMTKIGQKQRA